MLNKNVAKPIHSPYLKINAHQICKNIMKISHLGSKIGTCLSWPASIKPKMGKCLYWHLSIYSWGMYNCKMSIGECLVGECLIGECLTTPFRFETMIRWSDQNKNPADSWPADPTDPPLTNSGHSGVFQRFACNFDLRAYISWPGYRCPGRDGPPTFVSPRRVPHIQLHSVSNILDQSRWTDVNKVHRIHRQSLPIQQGCQHQLQVLCTTPLFFYMGHAPGWCLSR